MPIYEYQCDNCQHQFEKLQRMSDAVLTNCPECELDTLRKLISATGFQLKGEGWYVTDFKGGKKPDAASKTEPAKNKTEKATTTSKKTD